MTRRLVGSWAAWVFACAAVMAGCEAGVGTGDGWAGGPVSFTAGEGNVAAGMRAKAGQRVVFGLATVQNTGAQAATLRAVHLVGEVDPVDARLAEVRVIDMGPIPGSGEGLGAGRWPDREFLEWWRRADPIEEAELPPRHTGRLVLMINIDRTGSWAWPHTSLDYEVDGVRYTATSNVGFFICPPTPHACPTPFEWGDD